MIIIIYNHHCSSPPIGENEGPTNFVNRESPDQDVTDEAGWPLAWDAADAFFSPGKVEVLTIKADIPTHTHLSLGLVQQRWAIPQNNVEESAGHQHGGLVSLPSQVKL